LDLLQDFFHRINDPPNLRLRHNDPNIFVLVPRLATPDHKVTIRVAVNGNRILLTNDHGVRVSPAKILAVIETIK
jgi:hypothetical protein